MAQKKRHNNDGGETEPLAAPQVLRVAEFPEVVLVTGVQDGVLDRVDIPEPLS